jgi:hypothetical protein
MKNQKRKIALVVLIDGKQITIVTNANESIEQHLESNNMNWVKYLEI